MAKFEIGDKVRVAFLPPTFEMNWCRVGLRGRVEKCTKEEVTIWGFIDETKKHHPFWLPPEWVEKE